MTDPITRLNAALEGRYRIEREIGEGGMATVYLARDLKHNRSVALKVLKPELAAVVGAERFLAEIKTTANLQHPHILPLHDSGEADSCLYYVMPHVEGESLRQRIDRDKQLPVDEAVQITTAVAQALQHAHDRGVIHRDIKPANILIQDGQPVISDFGIALAAGTAAGSRLTETGLSLGTPFYMSPEQATGDQDVGPQADIYALGCVLYEMLVGEPPYPGNTAQSVLGKIIAGELIAPKRRRPSVPLNVDAALRRALEKLPADRFVSAQDFSKALADPAFRHGEEAVAGVVGGVGQWNRLTLVGWSVSALLAVALGGAFLSADAESRSLIRFEVTHGEDGVPTPNLRRVELAVSPDGSRIIYTGVAPDGGTQLWQRTLDDLEPDPIPGTEGGFAPAFSPDGLSVAFKTEATGPMKTASLGGGPSFTVVAETAGSPSWGDDRMIYFAEVSDRVTYRVPETGGEREAVTSPTPDGDQRFPDALPDGRGLLVTVYRGISQQARIGVVGPEGGEVREILTGAMARYATSGHIVYATAEGTLMAAPFDLNGLEVTGPSVALVEGVLVGGVLSQFALSESGTLLYRTGAAGTYEFVRVSRAGAVEPIDPTWTGDLRYPALSPDGRRLAITASEDGGATRDIWVKQLDRGPNLKLTFEGSRNEYPTWTPDGQSVTFFSNRNGNSFDLLTKRADGSAQAELALDREEGIAESLWSPDGEWVVYRTSNLGGTPEDILTIRSGQDTEPVALVATEAREGRPTLSPDGRWLAYTSNETGSEQVYVVPFPNAGDAKWAISTNGGTEPLWSNSGRELFYRNRLGEMVAVEVETEPTFAAGQPEVLFSAAEFRSFGNHQMYDVTPDDQQFIMIRPVGEDVAGELILVVNFFEELKRLVPN